MTSDPTPADTTLIADIIADIVIDGSCGCAGGGYRAAEKILAALVEAGWRAPEGEDESAPVDTGPVNPETLALVSGTTRNGLPVQRRGWISTRSERGCHTP